MNLALKINSKISYAKKIKELVLRLTQFKERDSFHSLSWSLRSLAEQLPLSAVLLVLNFVQPLLFLEVVVVVSLVAFAVDVKFSESP